MKDDIETKGPQRSGKTSITARKRQSLIVAFIGKESFCGITDLAGRFDVSEMTIRRDLEHLESEGLLRRTPGGAIPMAGIQVGVGFELRRQVNQAEKDAIGRLAAGLVQEGQTVFLDAGTTVLAMARCLKNMRRVQIVTSSLPVQVELAESNSCDVILIGGTLLKYTVSLVGVLAADNVSNMRFDWAFLGSSGIDLTRGLAHNAMEEIPVKRAAAASASKVVVLADRSKFRQQGLSPFLSVEEIDVIVTDGPVSEIDTRFSEAHPRLSILWPEGN